MTLEIDKDPGTPKRPLPIAAAGVALLLVLGWAISRIPAVRNLLHPHPADNAASKGAEVSRYFCPMHPFIESDHAGACPICNMTLVPKGAGSQMALPPGDAMAALSKVAVNPTQRVMLKVATEKVGKRELAQGTVAMGKVSWDERKVATVSARIGGRIEKLYVDFTGTRVVRGQPLVDIYSPDLVATQREYLLALEGVARTQSDPNPDSREASKNLAAAARARLTLWGITDAQIAELEKSKEPRTAFPVIAPVSGIVRQRLVTTGQYVTEGASLYAIGQLASVWVQAQVYEFETGKVSLGAQAVVTTEAYPGREFRGSVSFVDPFFNPETRTVRVRIELSNPGEILKPDMFVRVDLTGRKGTVLAIPETAVLQTGERAVVWVETEPNAFSPRTVKVGHRSDGYYEILDGLSEGESVVTSGGYLLDSESQLRAVSPVPAPSAPAGAGHPGQGSGR